MKEKSARPGRRVQLHRAVSKLGWGSRTQAWEWIRAGEIAVDGRPVTDPLAWVDLDRQRITRCGKAAPVREPTTLMLHKPRGVLTTRVDNLDRTTVHDLLPPEFPYVFAVGRLDADSEGLLLMTSDSSLSHRLTDPDQHVPKTYRVTVSGQPDDATLERLCSGIDLDDGPTRPAKFRLLQGGEKSVLEVVLTEGRNRQIRRMLASVGHKVRRLVRLAVGRLHLGSLPPGAYRLLGESDLALLE